MRSYRSIMVALDFSDCSQELIDQAVSLADAATAILLTHVAELPEGLVATAKVGPTGGAAATAKDLLIGRSLDRLGVHQRDLSAAGHRAEIDVAFGHVAETIVARAQHLGAELIIMGTHGRRGVSRAVGGSIAAEVVALATCPVLTMRTAHRPTCQARSCDRCEAHLTSELRQLIAERDG